MIDSLLKPPQSTSSETPILLHFFTTSETQTTNPPASVSLTSAHSSTQTSTLIPSEPIQTQTSPISSTNFSNPTPEYLDALDREIYNTNPVPLNSAPPLNPPQSDSEVNLSESQTTKSPLTHTLPETHTNPPHTPPSNPLFYDFQGPSTPSEEYFSEPASPEITDIQSSSSLPVTNPLSAIVVYQPRPLHPLKCINSFFETASKRASELLASTSAHPEKEQVAWMEFHEWLNSELSYILHSSKQAMEFCVAAATKRREEKLKAIQEREVLMIQATQAAIEEEAKNRLAVLQAQEEAERARREEAARIEAEKEKAAKLEADRILAEEDAVRADAMRKQQAEHQRLAAELAEKNKSEIAEAAAAQVSGASSEARSSDAARLDAVEQKMEKFSKEQEDMHKQLSSHGEMLKLILEKLP